MSAIDPITGRTPTYKVWTDSNTGQQVRPHPVGEPNAAAQIRDNVVRLQEMLQQKSQRVADLLDAYQALCRALRYHHRLTTTRSTSWSRQARRWA